MSERSWSLLGLAAILILAGSKALVVLALALAFGVLLIVVRMIWFVVKSLWGWIFGK